MIELPELVYGDTGTDVVISLKDKDGTAVDVTGASSIYLKMVPVGGGTTVSVTGAIYGTATNGQFSFEDVANSVAQPSVTRPRTIYECRVTWVKSAETYWSAQAFRIPVVRFP